MKEITIHDVARLAGVSIATVSMVLKDTHNKISGPTRERVLEAARSLNYSPPSKLKDGKNSRVLGMIVPSITNPYYPPIIRGADEQACKSGYQLLVCTTHGDSRQDLRCMELLFNKRVDGIILTFHPSDEAVQYIERHPSLPVASFSRIAGLPNVDYLTVDNEHGGYSAARHLIELGHRRVAYIGPNHVRLRGFRSAFTESGLQHDPKLVLLENQEKTIVIGEDIMDLGFSLARQLLKENPDLTAIFAYNDFAAFGAMEAVQDVGLSIPQDVSIIGYDDVPFGVISSPSLTTVNQPKYERGADSVSHVLRRVGQGKTDAAHVVYRPHLVIRKSTGPVRQ